MVRWILQTNTILPHNVNHMAILEPEHGGSSVDKKRMSALIDTFDGPLFYVVERYALGTWI